MKLARARTLIFLLAPAATCHAYAACATDDPVAVAKTFFSKHAEFSSEDPAKIKTNVTARFFAALDLEYKCAQGDVCAIEADPWTDAQDGTIGKPVEFAIVNNTGVEANVSMTYPFILDKSHRKQRHATLVLQRQSSTDCWLVGDVIGPGGESLLQTIEKWHKEFGGKADFIGGSPQGD